MSPHDATTDSTIGYELTGRHLQVAAILGHVPHGGRVRLTVTELGQIGELVAWGEALSDSAIALSGPVPRSRAENVHGDAEPSWGDSGRFEESA